MKLLFWIVKNKINNAGQAPIYARITIQGKLAEISTGIKIYPHRWIAKGNGYIKGNTDQVRLQNARLSDIRVQIDEIYFDLLRRKQPITAQIIKDRFTGKYQASYSLLEIAQNLLQTLEEDPDVTKGTVRTYHTRIRNLKQWLASINRKDMLCEEVELQTAKDFMLWIRKRGAGLDHARKNALALKKVMNHAVAMKVVPGNPLTALRMKKAPPKPIVFLQEEEFALLSEYLFRSKRLQQVADLFIVQCCTGLAYAELARLKPEDISPGPDGRNWLRIERTKVPGAVCRVPLMAKAENVLTKYAYKLPIISNGNYNAYLKEVAEVVGIEKNLTTHVGRKTCGVLLINRDVPIETISRILGHSSVKVTQALYAQVLEKKIARDMAGIDF